MYLLNVPLLFSVAGWHVSEDELEEVATESGVLNVSDDFLEPEFRQKCEEIIPNVDEIEPRDFQNAFLYLKENFAILPVV